MQTFDRRSLDRLAYAFVTASLAAFATPAIGLQEMSGALTSGASALTIALGLSMSGRVLCLPERTRARKTAGVMLFEMLLAVLITMTLLMAVMKLYKSTADSSEESQARERLKDEIVNRGERTADEPAAAPDPGLLSGIDLSSVLSYGAGFLVGGLAIWAATRGLNTLLRRRRARRERARLAGQLSHRHAALYARARKAAKTDPLKRLFEVAGELEAVSPEDRVFVDRYLGELEKLATELKTFDRVANSRAGQNARRDFDASVERTVELMVDRRERQLEKRALTFQTTADVLGQLTRDRGQRERVPREESA